MPPCAWRTFTWNTALIPATPGLLSRSRREEFSKHHASNKLLAPRGRPCKQIQKTFASLFLYYTRSTAHTRSFTAQSPHSRSQQQMLQLPNKQKPPSRQKITLPTYHAHTRVTCSSQAFRAQQQRVELVQRNVFRLRRILGAGNRVQTSHHIRRYIGHAHVSTPTSLSSVSPSIPTASCPASVSFPATRAAGAAGAPGAARARSGHTPPVPVVGGSAGGGRKCTLFKHGPRDLRMQRARRAQIVVRDRVPAHLTALVAALVAVPAVDVRERHLHLQLRKRHLP